MDQQPQPGIEPPLPPSRREPFFNLPGLIVLAVAVMVGLEALQSFVLGPDGLNRLAYEAAFIPARYTAGGPVDGPWLWSPITYSFIHGGWLHLILNSFWLAAFGAIVARRIGTLRFVVFWIVAAVVAAFAFALLNWGAMVVMVGASGVVSALMGAASRFAFPGPRGGFRGAAHLNPRQTLSQSLSNRTVITFLAVWFGVNLLAAFGVAPGAGQMAVAWEAHVGGFLFGFIAFPLFDPLPEEGAFAFLDHPNP